MAEHNDFGKAGEDAAAIYLKNKGYVIRHRNWKSGRLELDLVAFFDGTLIIAEVKTRKSNIFGSPLDAVTESKIKRIVSAANAYVRYFRLDLPIRFDIVSIVHAPNGFEIEHIEDAFTSPLW